MEAAGGCSRRLRVHEADGERPLPALISLPLALLFLGAGACGPPCGDQPACKFVDLLTECLSAPDCPVSGAGVKVLPGANPPDAGALQTMGSNVSMTLVSMFQNDSIEVPFAESAATIAALPILDIQVLGVVFGSADQVSVLINGQPWIGCEPQHFNGTSEEWKCPLPAGTQTLGLRTQAAGFEAATIALTEATCTGHQYVVCGD
jgi:hypothetical protein